jgi:hypothetical protein
VCGTAATNCESQHHLNPGRDPSPPQDNQHQLSLCSVAKSNGPILPGLEKDLINKIFCDLCSYHFLGISLKIMLGWSKVTRGNVLAAAVAVTLLACPVRGQSWDDSGRKAVIHEHANAKRASGGSGNSLSVGAISSDKCCTVGCQKGEEKEKFGVEQGRKDAISLNVALSLACQACVTCTDLANNMLGNVEGMTQQTFHD